MVSLRNRQSTSSERSNESTAIDPLSVQASPKLVNGFERKSVSSSDTSLASSSSSAAEICSLQDVVRTKRLEPKDRRGWSHLAQVMSEVPEFAAFSRFREFNIKNLLYLQAELDLLQQHIVLHEEESTLNLKSYQHLIENADSCYHHSMMKSRSLLREYSRSSPTVLNSLKVFLANYR